jgi:hypothetical protein
MKIFTGLLILLFTTLSWGQTVLFVDDNTNITDNTDSVLYALQGTSYSGFDYYNIATSGTNPSLTYLSSYDLVIWYASTDGAGLGFWTNGSTGDPDLKNYLIAGGRVWIIGSDLLYAGGYSTPTTFVGGDFASDFMGLTSYDVQSYGDDGGLGTPMVTKMSLAPTSFPDTLTWIFSTAWWVDGVTSQAGAKDMYEMGPSTYALYQKVSMTHFKDIETNVMSTFFDPALIFGQAKRTAFLQETIFYMLNFNLGMNEISQSAFTVYPNPVENTINIQSKAMLSSNYVIRNVAGTVVANGLVFGGSIQVDGLSPGLYFLSIGGTTTRFVKI